MNHKLALVMLAPILLVPAAGCDSAIANPIVGGGSTSTSTFTSTASSSFTSTSSGTGTATGTGGAGGAPQACPCGGGEVCVDDTCHALAQRDTSTVAGGCTIVLDAANVYWSASEVRIVPKAGGPGASISPSPVPVTQPSGLWVDDTYLYFNHPSGGIGQSMKDGKSGYWQFVEQGWGTPTHMVGDGTTLYFLVPQVGIMQVATGIDSTGLPDIFTAGSDGRGTVAVDATSVYYWNPDNILGKEDKTSHVWVDLVWWWQVDPPLNLSVNDASGIVVDGATVYYSTAGGMVAKVGSAGGPYSMSTVLVDGALGGTGVFAVDADSIYFMTSSAVMKVPKAGGPAVLLRDINPPNPSATCMAADDTYVYWVEGPALMQYKK